jgi:hypothetical protein
LRLSENTCERHRAHRNYGLVYCHVQKNNPRYAGKRVFDGEAFEMPKTLPVLEEITEEFIAAKATADEVDDDEESGDETTATKSTAPDKAYEKFIMSLCKQSSVAIMNAMNQDKDDDSSTCTEKE